MMIVDVFESQIDPHALLKPLSSAALNDAPSQFFLDAFKDQDVAVNRSPDRDKEPGDRRKR